jgi:SpoIVB peptidase S55
LASSNAQLADYPSHPLRLTALSGSTIIGAIVIDTTNLGGGSVLNIPMTGSRVFYVALLSAAGLLCAAGFGRPSFSAAAAETPKIPIFPLSEIRPGMKGIGKTVFTGSKVEEFQVEVLGVLQNIAPRQSVILARLSGGPLENTGVAAGMSGSPVYIDGRLVGAVALGFQFSKEPIGGITPIEQMLQGFEDPATPPAPGVNTAWRFEPGHDEAGGSDSDLRVVSTATPELLPPVVNQASPVFWGGTQASLVPVATPLVLSGFTTEAIRQFEGPLRSLGLIPVQGGGSGSSGDNAAGDPSRLQAGSMISVQLVRGDMGASADGTVTLVDQGRVYAFGHPFLSAGATEIPFSESQVITVLANYSSSMKLTTPGGLLGVIGQDRSSGISGVLGSKARTIPVEIEVASSRGANPSYHFDVVNDRFLLPFLVNFTVFSAIGSTERLIGDSTLRVEETITIDGLPEVKSDSFVSASANNAAAAAQSAATPLAYLMQSGVGPLDIRNIHLRVASTDRRMAQEVEQVWGSKREVKPGDRLEVSVLLLAQDGKETLQKTAVEIPPSLTPGPLTITVADGASMDRQEAMRSGRLYLPKNPRQLVRAINKSRRNNRLYVRLARLETGFVLQGENFPSPPPSVVRALSGDPSASTNISPTVLSTIAEYDMAPVPSVVTGTKSITVTVKN